MTTYEKITNRRLLRRGLTLLTVSLTIEYPGFFYTFLIYVELIGRHNIYSFVCLYLGVTNRDG